MGEPTRRTCRVLIMGTGGTSNASARARIFCYLPLLRDFDIRAHVTSYVYHKHLRRPGIAGKLWLELLPLRNVIAFWRADTIYLHRLNYSRRLVNLARMLRKRVVQDFDDAVYLHTPDSADYLSAASNPERTERLKWILNRADDVIVSGEELHRYVAGHGRMAHVIPSVVSKVAEMPSVPNRPPVVGWVGAPENQRYLNQVEPALLRLQAELPDLEVWLITRELVDPPPRFRHRFVKWNLEAETEYIPKFTVGIAPLDNDPWCRAKMNYKALVYLSHGVPAVISPGGFPLEAFQEGTSILVARTADEWYPHVRALLENAEQRSCLASAGLAVLRKQFTPRPWVTQVAAILSGNSSKMSRKTPARVGIS
jgi:glycosyltransferase involved in cell wall biosynthesis